MENIYLSSKDFNPNSKIYYGYESNIYEFENDYLLKIFRKNDEKILQNKYDKLLLLSQFDLDLVPLKLVYIDGIFKGYIYKNSKDFYPINGLVEKRKEKEKILLKLKEKIEQLHNYGIIYGDLHQQNILYNGTDIILCDLDNVSINGYDFDTKNNHMIHYLNRINEIDTKLDNFIFNILTISYYDNITYDFVRSYLLNNGRLPHIFNTPENRKIIKEMLLLDNNYSGKLLIDNRKKKLTL